VPDGLQSKSFQPCCLSLEDPDGEVSLEDPDGEVCVGCMPVSSTIHLQSINSKPTSHHINQSLSTMNTNSSKVNAATAKNFTTVATKTHDGGAKATNANASEPAANSPRKPVRKHEDPFLHYSHQETRMNALLLRNDENNEQADRDIVVRKTRISFELDPALLLEDLFPDDVPEAEVRGVDTSSGDAIIDELWRLSVGVNDNDTTEM
jgi:hypothetical protein